MPIQTFVCVGACGAFWPRGLLSIGPLLHGWPPVGDALETTPDGCEIEPLAGAERERTQRVALRLVRTGFGLLAQLFRHSARDLQPRSPSADRAWANLTIVRADYGTLSSETLESFRAILMGLAAERRAALLAPDA
jgi:hypothetical protein